MDGMKHDDIDLRKFERIIDSWRMRVDDANDRKTYDEVFDRQTLMVIYKLFTDGVFDILDFPISTGKEGNVFRAITSDGDLLAVKIYRITNAGFKDLAEYVLGDPRFRNAPKRFPGILYVWAKKEYANLERFKKAGIRVPHPIALNKNVLVMEYIGTEESPARTLREYEMEEPREMAEWMLGVIRTAYGKGKIVHGDLSEYNVLITEKEPVVIDVAQSVLLEHWKAQELLERDVSNVSRYFKKFGVRIDVKEELKRIRSGEFDADKDS
jgi:RIO kinase 1